MAAAHQTYNNHTRFRPAYHFFVVPVLAVNFVLALRSLFAAPGLGTLWGVIFAAGLVTLALTARGQALTVQDRVIRLEMRLRLRELLPPDLQARMYELTPRQLIAMRFASDNEMADLTREVLEGNLPTTKAIKMRVRNWQADSLRA
jgi:hypothetical protein